jgi:hypothetical protein
MVISVLHKAVDIGIYLIVFSYKEGEIPWDRPVKTHVLPALRRNSIALAAGK